MATVYEHYELWKNIVKVHLHPLLFLYTTQVNKENAKRGISLVPSIAKVFEKLIYIELSKLSNLQAQSANFSITRIKFV
jgi:hypothetical protein